MSRKVEGAIAVPQAELRLVSESPQATEELAARLGRLLRAGDVVALTGDLGTGKTCFVRGLAAGMGVEGNITSPTFIIMRQHPGSPGLCHADAYRLSCAEELQDLGIEDVLAHSVLAVEWAEQVADALPTERINVALSYDNGEGRLIHARAHGERLAGALQEMAR